MPRKIVTLITLFIGILLGGYLQQYFSDVLLRHEFRAMPSPYSNQDHGFAMKNDHLADGKGEITWPNGDVYQGEFKNGMMHGNGRLYYASGEVYQGEFRYGRLHGKGEWTSADTDDEVHQYQGEWKNGDLVAARGDLTIYSPEQIAEHALYQQSSQLQQALNKILPGTADRVELFSFAVAGYGGEEVFRREINFIESSPLSLAKSSGHSLYLSNSRRSLDDRPLATITSLEKSFKTLGERMNTDEDILFFYLTSHGSRNRSISLQQPGLALADLSAEKLRELLDNSGIQWRVIILSACYSGGFIDALKSERSLIMTAAAADKTSFGCADNSDFTYFGKAVFHEALPQTMNFSEAFEIAKARINEWEKEEERDPSDPQIFIGAEIEKQLQRWRDQAQP